MTTADDRFAIHDTLHLYAHLVDSQQFERVAGEVFTEDAVLDWGTRVMRGRAELETWFGKPRPGLLGTFHQVNNIMVRLEGAGARALTKMVAWHWFDDGTGPLQQANAVFVGGGYEDELRRDGDSWKICDRRVFAQLGTSGVGIAADMPPWLVQLFSSKRGRRPLHW